MGVVMVEDSEILVATMLAIMHREHGKEVPLHQMLVGGEAANQLIVGISTKG